MKVDAIASYGHYWAHVANVYRALPDGIRGDVYAPPALGIPGAIPLRDAGKDRDRLTIVAGHPDLVRLKYRTGIMMEHGAGQSYSNRHPAHPGGDRRDKAIMFLHPNEQAADRDRKRYPSAFVHVIGSPRLAELQQLPRPEPTAKPVVCVATHWGCHIEGTVTSGPGIVAAARRRYQGDVITLSTASGYKTTVTPNHPILTTEGWVPAGDLKIGDRVVTRRGQNGGIAPASPDDQQIPTRVENARAALAESVPVLTYEMPPSPEYFDSNSLINEKVEVVAAESFLRHETDSSIREHVSEQRLGWSALKASILAGSSFLDQVFFSEAGEFGATGSHQRAPFVGAESSHPKLRSIGSRPDYAQTLDRSLHNAERDPSVMGDLGRTAPTQVRISNDGVSIDVDGLSPQPSPLPLGPDHAGRPHIVEDGFTVETENLGDLGSAFATQVQIDDLVDVSRIQFLGHVYSLHTHGEWYIADGFVVHNSNVSKESGSAWGYWSKAFANLAAQGDYEVIGHGHPRTYRQIAGHYRRMGIEPVERLEDVATRSHVFCCDNSSAMYELAGIGCPVVVLDAPWYRASTEHGLRFWSEADIGPRILLPEALPGAVHAALNKQPWPGAEERLARVFPPIAEPARYAADLIADHCAKRDRIGA